MNIKEIDICASQRINVVQDIVPTVCQKFMVFSMKIHIFIDSLIDSHILMLHLNDTNGWTYIVEI